ncbi:hypothetical protein HPB47_026750, partial [Ixodes persulcatus]
EAMTCVCPERTIERHTVQAFSLPLTDALLLAVSEGRPGPRCGPGEEYQTCGTACPRVCGVPRSGACTYQCVIGCACKPGFILERPKGKCIPEKNCPRVG